MEIPEVLKVETVISTNTFLIALSGEQKLSEGFTVLTEDQSAGRGQGQNQWESEPGANLTFSTLFYPVFLKARDQFWLSKAIAVGISDFTSKFTKDVFIKWPNDLYVGASKISGTLIENVLERESIKQSVVGIGFNVNQTVFRSNAPNPVSLRQLTNRQYSTDDLLKQLLHCLFVRYTQLKEKKYGEIEQAYQDRLFQKEVPAQYRDSGGIFTGIIHKVLENGTLEIERENGTISRYGFKEVEFVR